MEQKKKVLDYETALRKMQQYCAYQERSHGEVRTKLIDLGIYGEQNELIISELIQENFLNEGRFAKAFAHGKMNIKRWGRIRILQELKSRKISDYCIRKAMAEIDEESYLNNLRTLIIKKDELLDETDLFKKQQKLFAYLLQKGYEIELIQIYLKEFIDKMAKS